MTDYITLKEEMAEKRRTAEALILNGPDGPERQFLLKIIERRTGIKLPLPEIDPPARVGTDCPPPLGSHCARLQSDPSVPQDASDASDGQPAPQGEIGQPRACGESEGLFGEQRQPAGDAMVDRLKQTPPKPTGAGPTRLDPATDPEFRTDDLLADSQSDEIGGKREPGEDECVYRGK